jgi:cytochrome b6-f complex iron-sulfur subunit
MKEKISRKTFVRLAGLLGVSAAGASVLAACGGNSGGESGSGGTNDGSGGSGYSGDPDTGGSSGETTDRRSEKKPSGGRGDGSGKGGPAKTSGENTGDRTEKQASDKQAIARTSEVQPGTALEFEDSGGNPAVLVHLKSGNFVAYSALCTHEGCVVSYSNGQLACPCHGSIFDPANNARVVNGPARLALPKIPIEVRGGNVVDA